MGLSLFQSLFNSEDAAFVYLLDSQGLPGSLVQVNDAACRLLGCSREELLSAPQNKFSAWGEQAHIARLLRSLRSRRHIRFESKLRLLTGRQIPVEVSALLFSHLNQPASLLLCRSIEPVKRREKLLQLVKRRYRTIIQDQSEIILRFLPNGSLTFINQAGSRVLSLTPARLLKANFFTLLPAESADILEKTLPSLTALSPVKTVDFKLKNTSGEFIFCEWTLRAIFNARSVVEYQAVGRNISLILAARQALAKSEDKFRDLVETISDMLWETNAENRMVYVSPRCLDITGYSPTELLGSFGFELLFGKNFYLTNPANSSYQNLPFCLEKETRHRDGRTLFIEIRATPFQDENGSFRGYRGTLRDITFRKELEQELLEHRRNLEKLVHERTEELKKAHEQLQRELIERMIMNSALHESEEQLRTLINAMPDFVCFKDSDGHWLEANQFIIEMLGLEGVCYRGKTDTELAQEAPGFQSFLETCCLTDQTTWSQGFTCSFEEELLAPDGTLRTFETVKIPLYYPGGAKKGLVIIGRDITERRRAAEVRRELEAEKTRLDRLNLVGEMAVNIGHEIRNPMTTVRGYLQLMQTKAEFAAFRSWLDLMIDDLDKANGIISNFISLAKNKAISLSPCNLNGLILNALPEINMKASLAEKSITADLRRIPVLLLDEKEIHQLLVNLIDNALHVTAVTETVEVKTYYENNSVILEIADKGPGVPEQILDKLGTPFVSTKETGTGLGLAVCYHIANRHNAKIRFMTGETGTRVLVAFETCNL